MIQEKIVFTVTELAIITPSKYQERQLKISLEYIVRR